MVVGVYGQNGRGQADDRARVASATMAEAQVVIHRRIELRANGSIESDMLKQSELFQVSERQCDAALGRNLSRCVFLVYEIQ
ncbi:conserved hypothetical protein [Sphingorhabdus sp. 109]|nr:conserved hypothetical protein [Sphingorhabdus sp. 109]